MKPTATVRALRGVEKCTGTSGWATQWPGNVTDASLKKCVANGLLDRTVVTVEGYGNLGWVAYLLTPAGRAILEQYTTKKGE